MSFNGGAIGLSKIFEKLSMLTGCFTEEFCSSRDEKRIQYVGIKSSEKAKVQRGKKRAIRKGHLDKNHEKAGDTYVSGFF